MTRHRHADRFRRIRSIVTELELEAQEEQPDEIVIQDRCQQIRQHLTYLLNDMGVDDESTTEPA